MQTCALDTHNSLEQFYELPATSRMLNPSGRKTGFPDKWLLSEDRKSAANFLAHCKIAQYLPCVTVLEVRHPKSTNHILQKRGTPNAQHPEECRPERLRSARRKSTSPLSAAARLL
jgi:hypothetical protein